MALTRHDGPWPDSLELLPLPALPELDSPDELPHSVSAQPVLPVVVPLLLESLVPSPVLLVSGAVVSSVHDAEHGAA
jgi:hypothetical protein